MSVDEARQEGAAGQVNYGGVLACLVGDLLVRAYREDPSVGPGQGLGWLSASHHGVNDATGQHARRGHG